jgi:hypothetical protein
VRMRRALTPHPLCLIPPSFLIPHSCLYRILWKILPQRISVMNGRGRSLSP